MTSGPSVVLVLTKGETGEGIIEEWRSMLGPSTVEEAKEQAPDRSVQIIHCCPPAHVTEKKPNYYTQPKSNLRFQDFKKKKNQSINPFNIRTTQKHHWR